MGVRDATPKELKWLIDNKVTTALWTQHHSAKDKLSWAIDTDKLGVYGFAKALPPVDAFQQISSWVSSTIPSGGNPTVEIKDDKIKAHKHGFDKWSFRKKGKNSK
jgi:hypothetical protein